MFEELKSGLLLLCLVCAVITGFTFKCVGEEFSELHSQVDELSQTVTIMERYLNNKNDGDWESYKSTMKDVLNNTDEDWELLYDKHKINQLKKEILNGRS